MMGTMRKKSWQWALRIIMAAFVLHLILPFAAKAADLPEIRTAETAVVPCSVLPECDYIRAHTLPDAGVVIPVTGRMAGDERVCNLSSQPAYPIQPLYVGLGYHLVYDGCEMVLRTSQMDTRQ